MHWPTVPAWEMIGMAAVFWVVIPSETVLDVTLGLAGT